MSHKKSYCQNTSLAKRWASNPTAWGVSLWLISLHGSPWCPEGRRVLRRCSFPSSFQKSLNRAPLYLGYGGGYMDVLPVCFWLEFCTWVAVMSWSIKCDMRLWIWFIEFENVVFWVRSKDPFKSRAVGGSWRCRRPGSVTSWTAADTGQGSVSLFLALEGVGHWLLLALVSPRGFLFLWHVQSRDANASSGWTSEFISVRLGGCPLSPTDSLFAAQKSAGFFFFFATPIPNFCGFWGPGSV